MSVAVIGNISRDSAVYPGGSRFELLGGAALYIALAAERAGLPTAPVSVIGTDLNWIVSEPRLSGLDMRSVKVMSGESCSFRLAYDEDGHVADTQASFGVATALTSHALSTMGMHPACHVCCRLPLDVPVVLGFLAARRVPFSVDFHVASARALMPAAGGLLTMAGIVFVNAVEFAILARAIDPGDLQTIVISDGPRPAAVLHRGQPVASVVPPSTRVIDVTGAGDTLAGTFLAASARGLGSAAALHEAVSAASRAVAGLGLGIRGLGA